MGAAAQPAPTPGRQADGANHSLTPSGAFIRRGGDQPAGCPAPATRARHPVSLRSGSPTIATTEQGDPEETAAQPDGDAAEAEHTSDDDGDLTVGGALAQDEIDSLFTAGGGDEDLESPILAIIRNQSVNYERMPTLEMVVDEYARSLTASLRNLTLAKTETDFEKISAQRLGDYLDGVPLPAMIAVFKAVEWEGYGLLTLSSQLVYSIIDIVMGGRGAFDPRLIDGRPFTKIERVLTERLVHVLLEDLAAAFARLSQIEFRLERLETNPRNCTVAKSATGAILIRIMVEMDDRGGPFEILLPHATLEPVRELLLQSFRGEKLGADRRWSAHFQEEALTSTIEVEAILHEQWMPLDEVRQLIAGETLQLGAGADASVMLRCGRVPLLKGQMGRVGERLAIRVEGRVKSKRDETGMPPPS